MFIEFTDMAGNKFAVRSDLVLAVGVRTAGKDPIGCVIYAPTVCSGEPIFVKDSYDSIKKLILTKLSK